MDRIHHPTAIATPPALDPHPTAGYPTAGDPAGGIPGTVLTDWVLHQLIEEPRNVIVAAGLTPNKASTTQLRDALAALYGGAGTLAANGWRRLPGGLIVQWGAVARASRSLSTSVTVTFPIAFPVACYVVVPTVDYDNEGLLDMYPAANTPSVTQVQLLAGISLGNEGENVRAFGWRWIALGV